LKRRIHRTSRCGASGGGHWHGRGATRSEASERVSSPIVDSTRAAPSFLPGSSLTRNKRSRKRKWTRALSTRPSFLRLWCQLSRRVPDRRRWLVSKLPGLRHCPLLYVNRPLRPGQRIAWTAPWRIWNGAAATHPQDAPHPDGSEPVPQRPGINACTGSASIKKREAETMSTYVIRVLFSSIVPEPVTAPRRGGS
jgi:hypothetical protein